MLKRFHKLARILAVLALVIAVAGVGAPYLRADYFASRIQAGLERSLGRKVTIGNARYNVFRGPGFQVEEVTIAEDERIGIEPFGVQHHGQRIAAKPGVGKHIDGHVASFHAPTPGQLIRHRAAAAWGIIAHSRRKATARRVCGI